MDTVKRILGIGAPGGVDDLFIRAVKLAIFVFLSQPFGEAILACGRDGAVCSVDFSLVQSAAYAAAGAAVSLILNTVYLWASGGGSGQKTGTAGEVDRDAAGESGAVTIGTILVLLGILVALLAAFGAEVFGIKDFVLACVAIILVGIGVLIPE
jgi:hypothetical protein